METSRINFTMFTYIYFSNSSHNYRCTHTYIRIYVHINRYNFDQFFSSKVVPKNELKI